MLQFNNDIISGEVSQSVQPGLIQKGRRRNQKTRTFFYPFWSTESRLFLRKFVHYKSSHWSKKKWFGGGGLSRVQTFSLIGIFVTYKQIYPFKKILTHESRKGRGAGW